MFDEAYCYRCTKGITDEDVIRVIKVAEEIKEYMQKYAKMGL